MIQERSEFWDVVYFAPGSNQTWWHCLPQILIEATNGTKVSWTSEPVWCKLDDLIIYRWRFFFWDSYQIKLRQLVSFCLHAGKTTVMTGSRSVWNFTIHIKLKVMPFLKTVRSDLENTSCRWSDHVRQFQCCLSIGFDLTLFSRSAREPWSVSLHQVRALAWQTRTVVTVPGQSIGLIAQMLSGRPSSLPRWPWNF